MKKHLKYLLTGLAAATLVACGGGGGNGTSTTSSLTGTAAVGAPLAGATVVLKDSTGKTLTQTAGADGTYTFADVSGLTAPLMLQATGTAGGTNYTLHSLLSAAPAAGVSGVINVSTQTEAATAQAIGAEPAAVFADATKIKAIDATKLADAKARLNAALADVLTALGKDPKTVDVFTTAFKADNTGLDKLLDLVSVNNAVTSSGQSMQVTYKSNPTITTTITPETKTADVTKLAVTTETLKADASLDTSGIKTMISSFNGLTDTADRIKSAAMLDMFDADYLDNGKNRALQIADIADSAVGIQLSSYVLNGCSNTTPVVCQGQVTLTKTDKSTETFPLPVKLGTDGKWRAYGNQAPFEFDLKPVAYQQNYVGSTASAPTLLTGYNFNFTGYVGNGNTRSYQSAILYDSLDDGATWTVSTKLKVNSNCSNNFLPIDVGTTTSASCGNFKAVSDATSIANNNAAQAQGKKWFKIVAYPNADYTGTPTTYQHRSGHQLFDATTGAAALAASGLSITTSELGSNSVSFAGSPEYVNIAIQPVGASYAQNSASWNGSSVVKALGGKATTAAALSQCGSSCATAYGTGAKITSIQLTGRDKKNRGVWVQYSTGSTATSSTTVQ